MAKKAAKKRRSSSSIKVDPNVRCQRIYPVEDTKKEVGDLKTVGFTVTREQAIHLSRVLLAVSQEWDEMQVTACVSTRDRVMARTTLLSRVRPNQRLQLTGDARG